MAIADLAPGEISYPPAQNSGRAGNGAPCSFPGPRRRAARPSLGGALWCPSSDGVRSESSALETARSDLERWRTGCQACPSVNCRSQRIKAIFIELQRIKPNSCQRVEAGALGIG